ncbi:heavy metal translocating P-type ATPase [uncultured Gulosibacter sp.]|uniref:heavy metal translocating P-type ATPase n=1 Tax=uncultured Gulosibacter sp. TaxID=1339167 RepID=UPI0028893353|nr:heavy metal translocating P-type ATPase [uncultured Gulosibacter sp.]
MPEPTAGTIELDLQGMTCAACAGRIERKLNKMPGVTASVNFALERASVSGSADVDALIATVRAAGYDATEHRESAAEPESDEARGYLRRFIIAAVLSVPVIAVAMVPAWQFAGWQWVSMVLTLPVVLWAAWPFHRAALVNARHGTTSMDTLVSLGVTAATLWSLYALVFGHAGEIGMRHGFDWQPTPSSGLGNVYFEVAAGVVTFLLLGRYFEARAKRQAGSALRALLNLGAKEAELEDGRRVPASQLRVGDRFVVRPGDRVATDGRVVSGRAALDTSMLTGESVPVQVGEGSEVIGATVNTDGRLVVEATRVGADTQLAQMGRMVEQAQSGKAAAQRLADRISSVFVPVVIGLSLATLVVWLLAGGGVELAFTAAVAVLIIACPCALGLATPTAILAGTGRGAQLGILISGPEALERARSINTIVLDKTGTVTEGRMRVVGVTAAEGFAAAEVLELAAAVEEGSKHPLAMAIVDAHDGAHPAATDFTSQTGHGVSATVAGARVSVTRPGADLDAALADAVHGHGERGETAVMVTIDERPAGIIGIADTVRDSSAAAIAKLRELGMHPVLLTGDAEPVARSVAKQVGIDEVVAEVLPEQKVASVTQLQARGKRVAMVGDGVNDAPALATADLGIAMGGGTDAAMQAADITLVRSGLDAAVDAVRLSRRLNRVIAENLMWAFGYNVLALPLAAFGMLSPMIAGAAMAFSSVFVVLNSLRLLRFR